MLQKKWYGQNGTDKIINQSINPAPADNDFFINPVSTLTFLGFCCVFITYA